MGDDVAEPALAGDLTDRNAGNLLLCWPLPVSTSQSFPPFSVTSAMLVSGTPLPGRKAIAQGVSKLGDLR